VDLVLLIRSHPGPPNRKLGRACMMLQCTTRDLRNMFQSKEQEQQK
jgi:hypothetical protein